MFLLTVETVANSLLKQELIKQRSLVQSFVFTLARKMNKLIPDACSIYNQRFRLNLFRYLHLIFFIRRCEPVLEMA